MLSVQFDEDDYVKFSAAVQGLGARNISAYVHQFVQETIRNAEARLSKEEYDRLIQEHRERIRARGRQKRAERRKP